MGDKTDVAAAFSAIALVLGLNALFYVGLPLGLIYFAAYLFGAV